MFSDAAKRCTEVINQQLANGHARKWVAIRLSDGGLQAGPCDYKEEAVRHTFHYTQCMIVRIPWDGMRTQHAEILLNTHRRIYDAGFRMADM